MNSIAGSARNRSNIALSVWCAGSITNAEQAAMVISLICRPLRPATDTVTSKLRQAYAHTAVRLESAFHVGRTVLAVNPLVILTLPRGMGHLIYFSA